MRIDLGSGAAFDVPDEARVVTESAPGRPDLYRVFVGPIIAAASVDQLQDGDLGITVGNLVNAYADYPEFERSMLSEREVDGADLSYELSMTWISDKGYAMRSFAICSQRGDQAMVVNVAVPSLLESSLVSEVDDLLTGVRWVES